MVSENGSMSKGMNGRSGRVSSQPRERIVDIARPFICAVIQEPTPAKALAEMQLAERAGASAFELNLTPFEKEYRDVKHLAELFRHTTLPIFTLDF
jgi:hypothetical protein